jgi:PKD repeat protein
VQGSGYTLGLSGDGLSGWSISWGDGAVDTLAGDATSATHTYADPGTYTISATATLADGTSYDVSPLTVTVSTAPAISGAGSAVDGSTYTLGLSGDGLSGWSISWGDGAVDTLAGDATSATHTYADPGTYTISAAATLADGSTYQAGPLSVTVSAAPVAPSISGAGSVAEGAGYTLSLSGDGLSGWSVSWGDGVVDTLAGSATSATHAYADGPNTYSISAVAVDQGGTTHDTNTVSVSVQNVDPVLSLSGQFVDPTHPSSVPLTGDEAFVRALYRDALGRDGAVADLDGWVEALHAPGGSRAAVAAAVEGSAEARTRLVRGWYLGYLGRAAAGGEEQGWVNALLAGAREEEVLAGLLGSPEFYARAQAPAGAGAADERFVQALYGLLLGRAAGASEAAGWAGALPALGRAGLAGALLASAEYRSGAVASYYRDLLHRAADPAGLAGWASSGLGLFSVRVGIEGSDEFYANG